MGNNFFPDTTGYLVSGNWLREAEARLSAMGRPDSKLGYTLHGLIVPVYVSGSNWVAVSSNNGSSMYKTEGKFVQLDGPNDWRLSDLEYPIWSYVKTPISQGSIVHVVYRGWWEVITVPTCQHIRGTVTLAFTQNATRDADARVILQGSDEGILAKSPLCKAGDTLAAGTLVVLSYNSFNGDLEIIQAEC